MLFISCNGFTTLDIRRSSSRETTPPGELSHAPSSSNVVAFSLRYDGSQVMQAFEETRLQILLLGLWQEAVPFSRKKMPFSFSLDTARTASYNVQAKSEH